MRRVRYSVATSLDGYIAGPQGEYDWIVMDPDIDFAELFKGFDTVLMGRKSYEVARQMGQSSMPGLQTYVFSRTLRAEDCPGVVVSSTPADTTRALKAAPGSDIWLFGGGELFRVLLAANLVDAVEVAVVPVLLGAGTRLLPAPAARTALALVRHRVYEGSGIVALDYEVRRAG